MLNHVKGHHNLRLNDELVLEAVVGVFPHFLLSRHKHHVLSAVLLGELFVTQRAPVLGVFYFDFVQGD